MRKIVAYIVCAFALLLPIRLRVLLAEAIGWSLQFCYWMVYRLARFIVVSLRD